MDKICQCSIFASFELLLWQINRRALVTDEWLRVEGSDNIYALGDCATINQRKVMVGAIYAYVIR